MILKGQYINDDDITRMEYFQSSGRVGIYRVRDGIPCQEVYLSCTREEYEIAIMHLERNMELRRIANVH